MGLFGWKFSKKNISGDGAHIDNGHKSSSPCSDQSSTMKTLRKRGSFRRQHAVPGKPNLDHLPDLILDLKTAVDTAHPRSVGALRKLFTLSEDSESNSRIRMVHDESGALVNTLLYFLDRCVRKSPEQSLSLLILNNLSIPLENKRVIAMDYEGARILSKMLCDDPSCHLLAIVLVNLTFSDVSDINGIGLSESLAFAWSIASLTEKEYQARRSFIEDLVTNDDLSPSEKLSVFMGDDHRLIPEDEIDLLFRKNPSWLNRPSFQKPCLQCFPDTAKWCLIALRNLTRPCKDATTAHVLIKSGIFSLILRNITIVKENVSHTPKLNDSIIQHDSPSESSEVTKTADPLDMDDNEPSEWESNSIKDVGLHIVLNMAACPVSREYVFEVDAVSVLCGIADFSRHRRDSENNAQKLQKEYQCLKARTALAFLLGSQGHFGQAKITVQTSSVSANPADSPLVMTEADIELLLEILLNTTGHRGKDGPGGYSATVFDRKIVLFAFRCFLTHTANQTQIAGLIGRKLNVLLLRELARFSIGDDASMDKEAAEHAVFCLYLQSNCGFDHPFLPLLTSDAATTAIFVAKVFMAYLQSSIPTAAGKHAAEQLLLRLTYLSFDDHLSDVVGVASTSLFDFGEDLLSDINAMKLGRPVIGAKPKNGIFDRPVIRSQKFVQGTNITTPRGDKTTPAIVFANALQAVQQLSYGSIKVRHVGVIDDIMIANNIVSSACGEKTESYNFTWAWWEDSKANGSSQSTNYGRCGSPPTSPSSASLFQEVSARLNGSSGGSPSAFPFYCGGSFCSADTTM